MAYRKMLHVFSRRRRSEEAPQEVAGGAGSSCTLPLTADARRLCELKCLSLPHGSRAPWAGGQWNPTEDNDEQQNMQSPVPLPVPLGTLSDVSDTSYEKACRRGSGGPAGPGASAPVGSSPSRLAAFFFSKRSLRASPLKRARSAAKLAPRAPLRSSRSHESLLSAPAACATGVRGGTVRALHASLSGRAHCFLLQLPGPPPRTRHFACASRMERDTWINNLRASLQPQGTENSLRIERSLRLCLLEAKGLPAKKRYYCELLLDATLYARTSSKLKTEMCFWGEVFEFSGLPHVNVVTLDVYREADRKHKKRDKRFLVGSVKIPIQELGGRTPSERWHPLLPPGGGDGSASVRVRCSHKCLRVLPLPSYSRLLPCLRDTYPRLLECLEPVMGVKTKEELSCALVSCVRAAGGAAAAARLLASAAALEVARAPHAALAFRANSLATKATEAYMKMLGETYLQETLWETVSGAVAGGVSWEVDPARANTTGAALRRQRARLRAAARQAWHAVSSSAHRFPHDLRLCFAAFREKLRSMQREELTDHLVSASVFLRFLCPAILSPSLFGITHEYPDERAGRNLTLVAKSLQTLANFTRFQGKEAYMEFLNDFLEEEAPSMLNFLNTISTLPPGCEDALNEEWGSGCSTAGGASAGAGFLDLGKNLAALHLLLGECVPRLPLTTLQELEPLPSILEELTQELRQLSGSQPDLTQAHSPVMHDNIFRFNDPTYSPSSMETSNGAHGSPLLSSRSNIQSNTVSSSTSSSQTEEPGKLLTIGKSPNLGIRAATLPRHNYFTNQRNTENSSANDRYVSHYNSREHCVNLKVLQIGFEQKNSSTPSLKMNGSNGNLNISSQSQRRLNVDPIYDNNNRVKKNNYNLRQGNNVPTNLDDLNDLLRYADDHDDVNTSENISNDQNVTQNNVIVNNNKNANNNLLHNGSNVSISALSNVASSGYQSFATYSQSSSPVESYNANNCCEGNAAQKRPLKSNYPNKNAQRYEFERQKFAIQNFTRDPSNRNAETQKNTPAGPLTFTNPVYHVDETNGVQNRDDSQRMTNTGERNMSTTSSSSIDEEEEDTTDNVESNSKNNYRNGNKNRRVRNGDVKKNVYGNQEQQNAVRHSKSNVEPIAPHRRLVGKSRSNGSEISSQLSVVNTPEVKLKIVDDRRALNSRLPRTNPLFGNVTHFGQNAPLNDLNVRYGSRPDSNVEETNKEMYRLQISRSQKALYDRGNGENYSNSNLPRLLADQNKNQMSNSGNQQFKSNNNAGIVARVLENGYQLERNFSKSTVNEEVNGYPLERVYSKVSNVSSTRLNEEMAGMDLVPQVQDRAARRLSLEGAALVGDSSSEQDDGCYHTTGRRRVPKNHRTIHQYEREIERLKVSVDMLRQKLQAVQVAEDPASLSTDLPDSNMKGIISRLLGVEEELRREQRAMSAALHRKQRVIERQGQRLQALVAANSRLLSALHNLHPPAPNGSAAIPGEALRRGEQLLAGLQADLAPLNNDQMYNNYEGFDGNKAFNTNYDGSERSKGYGTSYGKEIDGNKPYGLNNSAYGKDIEGNKPYASNNSAYGKDLDGNKPYGSNSSNYGKDVDVNNENGKVFNQNYEAVDRNKVYSSSSSTYGKEMDDSSKAFNYDDRKMYGSNYVKEMDTNKLQNELYNECFKTTDDKDMPRYEQPKLRPSYPSEDASRFEQDKMRATKLYSDPSPYNEDKLRSNASPYTNRVVYQGALMDNSNGLYVKAEPEFNASYKKMNYNDAPYRDKQISVSLQQLDASPRHQIFENKSNYSDNKSVVSLNQNDFRYMENDEGRYGRLMSGVNKDVERGLIPNDSHQAVVSTQPAIYYAGP